MARRSMLRRGLGMLAWSLAGLLLFVVAVLVVFRFANPPTTAFIVAHQLEFSGDTVRQQWVRLSDISPWMPLAVVASEDQRFPEHWGVDVNAIKTAVADFRQGDGLRGASTITQQTAKNLFLWNGRSFARKALEAGLAVSLEAIWPKRRIMEVYLNVAEFDRGIYGVEAASQAYFGTSARHLTSGQAARLAAVLPNPKVFDAGSPSTYVWQRVNWIEGQMKQLSGLRYLEKVLAE
ncbi:monofunctional biosynthetic peptidoglycan transglycosylase [Marinobacter changyiensis]|uniref:monofunctional biosynthetic peptidoglycan transglycosylase n=1 Tax=Marinobacter changyiensis TaxID=2604091 RepID=UPI001FEAD3A1|nr:monofunctional biosynthetic peptidoglycan transglycosylase [Marinobacter changyiensis]